MSAMEPPLRPSPSANGTIGRHSQGPARHQGHHDKAKGKPARRETAARFAVLNAFVDFALAGMARNEIAVWLVLYRDTKPDGTARTSQADLARRNGTSDRTVRRALGRLETAGLLKVVYRGGFRRGQSRYRVGPLRADGA
jgi:hypothetical protein